MTREALFSNAVIFAAGSGSRMMPLTKSVPKPLAPFQSARLIDHGIKTIQPYVRHLYVTVGHCGDILAKHVIANSVAGVFNTTGQDNGWWITNTPLRHIDEPMLVSTCDNLFEINFEHLRADYDAIGQPACMIVPVRSSALAGDRLHTNGRFIKSIGPEFNCGPLASGLQILRPKKVARLANGATDFREIWDLLATANELVASRVSPTRWAAVDTLKELAENEANWTPSEFSMTSSKCLSALANSEDFCESD